MNGFDLVISIFMFYFVIKGALNGLIKEVFDILGIVLALIVCYVFGSTVAALFMAFLETEWSKPITYIILFVSIYLFFRFLSIIFTRFSKSLGLNMANRMLGSLIGLVKAISLILAVYYVYLELINYSLLKEPEIVTSSQVYPVVQQVAQTIKQLISP